MSLLDSAESEGSKTSLSEGTVVENLIINVTTVSANVGLHHDVLSFAQSVVESVMVHLIESSTLALSGGRSLSLDKVHQVLNNFSRVFTNVDGLINGGVLGGETGLDAFVHLVVLKVDVLELD